jgi:tetratricopeptide (TPR) repeat protein
MAKETSEQKPTEPAELSNKATAEDYVESGWQHYSKKEYFRAEANFQKALEITPNNADTMYALAMTMHASGRAPEAIQAFEKVLRMLEKTKETDPVRALMLARLSNGHINRIKTGDWKLDR